MKAPPVVQTICWGKTTHDLWIPFTKGQYWMRGKLFHFTIMSYTFSRTRISKWNVLHNNWSIMSIWLVLWRHQAIAWNDDDLSLIGKEQTSMKFEWKCEIFSSDAFGRSSVRGTLFCSALNVRGPSKLGLTRSISWLLMPWLLTSPGHQQPWYWLYRICRSLSYLKKNFKYLCHINVEKWHKMYTHVYVYVHSEKFTT